MARTRRRLRHDDPRPHRRRTIARSADRASFSWLVAGLRAGHHHLAAYLRHLLTRTLELAASILDFGASPARLLTIGNRLARARTAVAKLYSRALPAPGELRAKVEAAERMVARAEQRLAKHTARHQATLRSYARRDERDRAAGRRRALGRPPAALDTKAKVVRHRNGLARAKTWLQLVRHPVVTPAATARASMTDPQSRLMLGKHGGFVQGYNIQIASVRNQLLLAIEVHDNPADKTALVPMIRQTQHTATLPE